MRTRLPFLLVLTAAAAGCSGVNPTGPNEPCGWYCEDITLRPPDRVSVRGVLLTPEDDPVPDIEITGTGREGTNPSTAVTGPDGHFGFSRPIGSCFPASTHPAGANHDWVWLDCPGCQRTTGACYDRVTRSVVRYTG